MASYTCITCHVAFAEADAQREHYKTDWHRYNLKRKVVQMPPVTEDDFQQRLEAQKAAEAKEKKATSLYCTPCRRHFGNDKAYVNHINSKKHQEMLLKSPPSSSKDEKPSITKEKEKDVEMGSDEYEEVDSDEWEEDVEPIPITQCLFCGLEHDTLANNMKHMSEKHSFFVPDVEYLVDLEGLIEYLGGKVGQGNMCLWCNERGKKFHSIDAARKHMLDKGHTKMIFEGEALLEYSDFFDYSSTYPEGEGHDRDEPVDIPDLVVDSESYQLTLPSGATVGHRSLARYYRQKLPLSQVVQKQKAVDRLMCQYRAIGWKGSDVEAARRRARDLYFVSKVKSTQHMKLGVKGNKLQRHFRPQVNF
ncbi:unnamed protein product [Darwinula stevensoni]|uniref:C2H2-type domain-containing protein n=1 Tax=Darwinula stevensoni TaxID=69355 RepID=A0A7R9A8V4_9CRUS|nr:unnamed protein product [Darwinula stevensoni]CAG0896842.1 unnamed protein product [Darwinula stevensoni]